MCVCVGAVCGRARGMGQLSYMPAVAKDTSALSPAQRYDQQCDVKNKQTGNSVPTRAPAAERAHIEFYVL